MTLARGLPRRGLPYSTGAYQWRVDEFALVDSNRSERSSTYSIIDRWALAAPQAGKSR